MKIDETTIKRLAFIKYLYKNGFEQSQKPEPMCAASVLTFHDSIELFLQLSAEILDISKKDVGFMKYWEILTPKLSGKELSQKESLRRLNQARVALKHHGTRPSKSDIEGFRASATNFFEENTPTLFGLDFDEISLIDLVQCDAARDSLKKALENLKQNEIEKGQINVALAFHQIVDDYESRKKGILGNTPFAFGEALTRLSNIRIETSIGGHTRFDGELRQFVDTVKKSIESLKRAVEILSLGLDYRRYTKFRMHTNSIGISKSQNGSYQTIITKWAYYKEPLPDEIRFCMDFVIESAIVLQQFDYNVEVKMTPVT